VTFSNRERRVQPGRLMLTFLLPLFVMTIWHIKYYEVISALMNQNYFLNFVSYSYDSGRQARARWARF
jgi:hypothetical protein